MGIELHTCHHMLYGLDADALSLLNTSGRSILTSKRLGIGRHLWSIVAERAESGETLRALGREYGVSRECIRRIIQTERETRTLSAG